MHLLNDIMYILSIYNLFHDVNIHMKVISAPFLRNIGEGWGQAF